MRKSKHSSKKASSSTVATLVRKTMENLAETKVFSVNTVTQTVTLAGTVANITNAIIEGDDIGNRAGTKIHLKRVKLYFRCFSVTNSQTFRFILFRDLFNQGTTPAVVDLLPTGTWTSQYSDIHQIQQKRFHIIEDWMVDCNLTGNNIRSHVKDIALTSNVYFNGTTAVAASNGRGAMFLLIIGSSATGTFDFNVQVMFNDS